MSRALPEWIGKTPDAKVPPRVRLRIFLREGGPDYLSRLLAKVVPEPNSGCWLWVGAATRKGYGHMKFRSGFLKAHRISFLLHRGGPIPRGMVVCHSCDVPSCVNPDHLFLGTLKANIHDCITKGRAKRGTSCGENNGSAKLSAADVAFIRATPKRYGSGIELAAKFGVTQGTISVIRAGRAWGRSP